MFAMRHPIRAEQQTSSLGRPEGFACAGLKAAASASTR